MISRSSERAPASSRRANALALTVTFALSFGLGLASEASAQRQLNILREEERVAREREREWIDSLRPQELEGRAQVVAVLGAGGELTLRDRQQASPTAVEVVELRIGKATAELGGEATATDGWQARKGRLDAAKPSKKLKIELRETASGKKYKLTCSLSEPSPPAAGEVKLYVIPGEEVDFHCRDLQPAG